MFKGIVWKAPLKIMFQGIVWKAPLKIMFKGIVWKAPIKIKFKRNSMTKLKNTFTDPYKLNLNRKYIQ